MHWHSFQDWFFWYFSYRFIMIHWDTINLYLKMWCITKINPASIYVHMAMTIIKLNLATHMTHYTVTLNLKLTNTTKAANDWHCCNAIIHFFLTDRVTLAGQVATVQCCHSLTQSVTLRCLSIDDSCLWILGMTVWHFAARPLMIHAEKPRFQIGTLESWNESDTSLLVHWWFMPRSQDSRLKLWIVINNTAIFLQ